MKIEHRSAPRCPACWAAARNRPPAISGGGRLDRLGLERRQIGRGDRATAGLRERHASRRRSDRGRRRLDRPWRRAAASVPGRLAEDRARRWRPAAGKIRGRRRRNRQPPLPPARPSLQRQRVSPESRLRRRTAPGPSTSRERQPPEATVQGGPSSHRARHRHAVDTGGRHRFDPMAPGRSGERPPGAAPLALSPCKTSRPAS